MNNDKTGRDAKVIAESELSMDLIKILIGDRKPTAEERTRLKKIKAKLEDRLYTEIIYLLTNISIENPERAKKFVERIQLHRESLKSILGRDVGIQVSALDYMQNKENIVYDPTFIEREKMKEIARMAITDDDADIYDKTMFFSDLNDEMKRGKRYDSVFSIILIDIDNFKEINDTYGHLVGDTVIQNIINLIKKNIRITDTIYRYGGDEFVILLPETGLMDSKKIAVKIMNLLKRNKLKEIKGTVSLSMGIVSNRMGKIDDSRALLDAADGALYKAKESGKDKIFIIDEGEYEEIDFSHKGLREKKHVIHERRMINGIAVSPGRAHGTVYQYRDIMSRQMGLYHLAKNEVEGELKRIRQAMEKVQKDLVVMRLHIEKEVSTEHAAIFDVHKSILCDEVLINDIESELKKRMINAEHVVIEVFKRWERKFKTASSIDVRDKCYDIADIGRRVLRVLRGIESHILEQIPENSVIFAKRLLPSDTVNMNKHRTRAVVTEEGSKNSHSALLARAMGIPAVVRVGLDIDDIPDGAEVIVDGDSGKVIVYPDREELNAIKREHRKSNRKRSKKLFQGIITINEEAVTINANIGNSEDAKAARDNGCDGIGLFRIEQIYMASSTLPDEKQLIEKLQNIVKYVSNMDITVRLLDVGGDKLLPYIDVHKDQNSALGLRGIRLLLQYPKLLETQITAILKLSMEYKLRILVPFVSLSEDLINVRKALEKVKKKLGDSGIPYQENIQLGAMIETPASVISIEDIINRVDFVSIGTNDLVQYTMAADRGNQSVSEYYEEGNRIVLTSIGHVLERARASGIDCALCGELAGDFGYTKNFIKMGLRNFSVTPYLIPHLRKRLHGLMQSKDV